MRLETISEGKAIILTPEAYTFADKVAAQAYKGYKEFYERIVIDDSRLDKEEEDERTIKFDLKHADEIVNDEIVIHQQYRPERTPIEVIISYVWDLRTEGSYSTSERDKVNIKITVGCLSGKLNPAYIKEVVIHELTHAVDPKVNKDIPGTRTSYDVDKIRSDEKVGREFHKYARQPVEVEAVIYPIANRFVRSFISRGFTKAEILDKTKNFTPEVLDEVFKNHAYLEKLNVLLQNKAYRRKLINTILHIISGLPNNESTSHQRRLTEADISRRQFLKLGGQAAMAAAAPKTALKGLMGGFGKPIEKILVSVQPALADGNNLEGDLRDVTVAFNAAKKLGGMVGGDNIGGEAFEFLTMANSDTLDKLVANGTLKPTKTFPQETFNKPIEPETLKGFRQKAAKEAREYAAKGTLQVIIDQEAQARYEELIRQETYGRSLMYLTDKNGVYYLITTPNEATKDDYKSYVPIISRAIVDPIISWWKSEIHDLQDFELTKPIVELIKQKGLYRDIGNSFDFRHLMNGFEKFGVTPPADVTKIIARLDKIDPAYHDSRFPSADHPTYSELKPDDTWESWSSRKRVEHKKRMAQEKEKQKQEFDDAPPPQETPDSWRTQSVEFEHKLVARLRRL